MKGNTGDHIEKLRDDIKKLNKNEEAASLKAMKLEIQNQELRDKLE